tara:strand:- start:2026 stop:2862 length:837 start_codon:yes stop_codon:yes gene_type:complete
MNNSEKIKADLLTARQDLLDIESNKRKAAIEAFKESGGCETCCGRGWIVTWDTLDCTYGSYAQYSSCTNEDCTETTRSLSGLKPRSSKYDRQRGTSWQPQYDNIELDAIKKLNEKIRTLQQDFDAETRKWSPRENVIVKVVRAAGGRKDRRTPVGVSGLVKRKFTNNWGTVKLLVVDEDGKKWWPSLAQVEVIDADPDIDTWEGIDLEERRREGYPIIATVEKKTSKAVLVKTITGVKFWVPVSQVPEMSTAKKDTTMSIMLPMWLAIQNKLVPNNEC